MRTYMLFFKLYRPVFKLVKSYQTTLNQAFVMHKIEKKVSDNEDLLPEHLKKNVITEKQCKCDLLFFVEQANTITVRISNGIALCTCKHVENIC